jgi:glycyl-tRNA synthetase beta chain
MLLEIGCEEIPASYIPAALKALRRMVEDRLQELRVGHGEVHVWGTPRRLSLMAENMDEVQADLYQEVIGPSAQVAFDGQGKPTAAAHGFARAQGVPVTALTVVETARGSYVVAQRCEEAGPIRDILCQHIPNWIRAIPFPKSMRWKDLDMRFARPIHWIVAMLGDESLPFDLENLSSGRITHGHRFMSPMEVEIPSSRAYLDLCRSLHVVVDPKEREGIIYREALKAAQALSGRLVEDPELLETIVYLVEYPVAITGCFEKSFLSLPREVLITAMREHQKFFSVEDSNGQLLPFFVNIANTKPKSTDLIREGNERVLRARLTDARFFFQEDRKRSLEERVRDLKGIIFHAKLGTLFEKVQRIRSLAVALAKELMPALVQKLERAALLCKADLTTEMVGEFPSLQGVMGHEYALADGEDPEVALAIREYYLPAFSGDRLPSGPVGALLGLADKLDTILGCFCVGESPTGAGDPFGLRRAALGIIHIMQERAYELPLGDMINLGLDVLDDKSQGAKGTVAADVSKFFRVRLQNLLASQGRSVEAVEAVLAAGFHNVPDVFRRLQALEVFMEKEDFADLAVSFKRVLNILGGYPSGSVDENLFQYPEERELFKTLTKVEGQIDALVRNGKPLRAFEALAATRKQIDRFFDSVLVNVEDVRIRENRLSLLARLGKLFIKLADFSKISTRP